MFVISRFSNKRSHNDQFMSLRQEAIMRNIEFSEFQNFVRRFDIFFDIFIFDLDTSTRDESIIFDFEIFASDANKKNEKKNLISICCD